MLLSGDAPYSALFVDWKLPGISGLEVTMQARAAGHHMPILMATAETRAGQVQEAIRAGVSDYLIKPFQNELLTAKLAKLRRYLEIQQLGSLFRVKHAMSRDVVSVQADTSAREAAQLLLDRQISGLPVVDAQRQLVGIITEWQLVNVAFASGIDGLHVGELMTTDVEVVNEETLLTEVASMILRHKLRRLPVVRGRELVGIVARRDVIRFALENRETLDRIARVSQASYLGPLPDTGAASWDMSRAECATG